MVQAVLHEIKENLQLLFTERREHTIFINKLPLAQPEREYIRDLLGVGDIKITLSHSDEPAEWLESATSGVWYGVFYNSAQQPILETIEICFYPPLAAAQRQDIEFSLQVLAEKLKDEKQDETFH